MSVGDSVIRVSIIGDVQNVLSAIDKVDAKTSGFVTSAAKVAVGGLLAGEGVRKVFDFTQDSLDKADDFNDKLDTLSRLTTPAFASRLHDGAFGLSDIGLGASDVADMATAIASFGKSAGVTEPTIEAVLPKLIDVAEAIHAKTGKTLDEVINDIGSAMAGNQKPLKDYGIIVDKALNPDETILSILAQAQTLYGDAKSAADDLHGTQDKINAKVDDFQIKLGEALEGPMNALASAGLEILDELKDWPGAVADILGPLARVADIFAGILDTARKIVGTIGSTAPAARNLPSPLMNGGLVGNESDAVLAMQNFRERNGVSSAFGPR